jgi:hypothetical protein
LALACSGLANLILLARDAPALKSMSLSVGLLRGCPAG